MDKEIKFICPKCGGQLEFIANYGYEVIRKINKRTGKLTKKAKKTKSSSQDWSDIYCPKCKFTKTDLEIIESDDENLQEMLREIQLRNY
ncbi:TPA: hypothetical protein ACG3P3_001638 [Clostridioides difficile]